VCDGGDGAGEHAASRLSKGVVAKGLPFVDGLKHDVWRLSAVTRNGVDAWGVTQHKEGPEPRSMDYMIHVSKYDNVKAQNVPAILMVSYNGIRPRMEGTTFTAKLRTMKTD